MQATNSNKKSLNTQTSVPGDRPMAPEVREVFNQIESMASEGAGIEEVVYKIMSQGIDPSVMSSALEHLGFTPDAVVDLFQRVELLEKEMLAQQQAQAQPQEPMMPQAPMGEQQMSPEQLDMMAQEAGQQLMQSEAMPSMAYGGSGNRGLGPFLGRTNDIARPLYLPPLPRRGNLLGAAFLLDDAAGQFFGNADRNKDGLMDGTFRDWNAKMARYKGKQNLNKTFEVDYGTLDPSNYVVNFNDFAEGKIRTKDQYIKDLGDQSALNFDPETNKYSGYFASNDLESRMIGKKQRDKNAISLSEFIDNVSDFDKTDREMMAMATKYKPGRGLNLNRTSYDESILTPSQIKDARSSYRDIMLGKTAMKSDEPVFNFNEPAQRSVVQLPSEESSFENPDREQAFKDWALQDPVTRMTTAGRQEFDRLNPMRYGGLTKAQDGDEIKSDNSYEYKKSTDDTGNSSYYTRKIGSQDWIDINNESQTKARNAIRTNIFKDNVLDEETALKYNEIVGKSIDDLDVSKYGVRVRQYPYGDKSMPSGHIEAGLYDKETGKLVHTIPMGDGEPIKGYINRWADSGNEELPVRGKKALEERNIRWANLELSEDEVRHFLKEAQKFSPTQLGKIHKTLGISSASDLPLSYSDDFYSYDFMTSNCADGVARALGLCDKPNETAGVTNPTRLMDNILSVYGQQGSVRESGGRKIDEREGLQKMYDDARKEYSWLSAFGSDVSPMAERTILNAINNLSEQEIENLNSNIKNWGTSPLETVIWTRPDLAATGLRAAIQQVPGLNIVTDPAFLAVDLFEAGPSPADIELSWDGVANIPNYWYNKAGDMGNVIYDHASDNVEYVGDILKGTANAINSWFGGDPNYWKYGGDTSLPKAQGGIFIGGVGLTAPVSQALDLPGSNIVSGFPVPDNNLRTVASTDNISTDGGFNVYKHLLQDAQNQANLDEAYNFATQWMSSPRYKEMLNKSGGTDWWTTSYDVAEQRINNLNKIQTVPYYISEDPNQYYTKQQLSGIAGYSDNEDGRIYVKPDSGANYSTLYDHEMSHSIDRPMTNSLPKDFIKFWARGVDNEPRLIPSNDVDLITNLIDRSIPLDYTVKFWQKYGDTPEEGTRNYYGTPTEVRARLNEIRRTLNDKGVDVFNNEITPDNFNKVVKNNAVEDLRAIYSDDDIIRLLNTISSVDDNVDSMPYAKSGGQLPKAQFGPPYDFITGFDPTNPFNLPDFSEMGQTSYINPATGMPWSAGTPSTTPSTSPTPAPTFVTGSGPGSGMGRMFLDQQALEKELEGINQTDQTANTTDTPTPAGAQQPTVTRKRWDVGNAFDQAETFIKDNPYMQAYGDVSNFAVMGANLANEYFAEKEYNDYRNKLRNLTNADKIYSAKVDPMNQRGTFDINTGLAEPDNLVDYYMQGKYGREMYKTGGEFEPHMMYDPKTGKAYEAKVPADHERMAEMGYLHADEMQDGGPVTSEMKAYLDALAFNKEARQAIGTNDREKLKQLRLDKPYSNNDLARDFSELQKLRQAAGLGLKEEASILFPHIGQQIRGGINSILGTNFEQGGELEVDNDTLAALIAAGADIEIL